MKNAVFCVLFLALIMSGILPAGAAGETALVPQGSTWKYLDDGSDQGVAWQATAFNDTAWASGPAQLGYGDGDEATVVSYGPDPDNKYITTYLRHSFQVANPSAHNYLRLGLLRDDGAVVYLNGSEILRSNMPTGAIDYQTVAASTVSGDSEDAYNKTIIDAGGLVMGTNTLAVEVHQRTFTSSDLSFDLEVAGLVEVAHPMYKGPYLIYEDTPSEMRVLWQLLVTAGATIEWGDDLSYSLGSVATTEYGAKHQHGHTITGLAASTMYYYRVIANEDTVAGSFRAAPDSGATQLKFLAYGDTRSYPEDHDQVAAAMTAKYTADPELQTMVLVVGDLVYDGDHEEYWQTEFFDSAYTGIQTMLADLPYQSARGNHEESGVLYGEYFPYPYVSDFYWSYDYGPVHFVVLDQYVDYSPGSAQLAWFEADLAATTKDWKVVYFHEPGWSAGGHANNSQVKDHIQPLCRQYGVAIAFAGHNHYYARANAGGIPHITTGGGGAPLYTPDPGFPRIKATAKSHHYCMVEVDEHSLHLSVYSLTDSLLDSITVANPTGVSLAGDSDLPTSITLRPIYPNPFNPGATIRYAIDHAGPVQVEVFDVVGRRAAVLEDRWMESGSHETTWNGSTLAGHQAGSGIYFVQLRSGADRVLRRITLVR